ncbi:cytochrome P450 [Polyporus arcularius HHB13444]|uniref:Cytochrome P450 n=1 Tax=Polyporus arcularius HHB13444 TaxID=1314778 RepID=A0A5C3NLQ8_9APHY|nr:cytochrome P450 [Polyporus arcularius HHB13444]
MDRQSFSLSPPGTAYWIPPWCLHRDPRNFSFPLSFWPERWLIASGQLRIEDARLPFSPPPDPYPDSNSTSCDFTGREKRSDAKVDFVHNDGAYIPFSYGPMNCPGKGLAMLEMRTVVCALLQRFEMRLREGWYPASFERGYKDYFSATRPELPVTLHLRW